MFIQADGCAHAVLAPGSKATLAAAPRLASLASNNGSIRTTPVDQSSGPLAEGFEPTLVISVINRFSLFQYFYFLKNPYQSQSDISHHLLTNAHMLR